MMHRADLAAFLIGLLVAYTPAEAAEPPITALAFPSGGDVLIAGSQAGLEVRSWPGLRHLRSIETGMANVHDLALSTRGDVLAVAGGTPAESGGLELLAWPAGDLLRRDEPHTDSAFAVAGLGDRMSWATAGLDRSIHLRGDDGALVGLLEGHSGGILALCMLPDGRTLVSGSLDRGLIVWDLEAGRAVRRLDQHTGAVRGLADRPGRGGGLPMVASIGDDRTVRFWQPTIGRMVRLARLDAEPLDLAWSPDGRTVAIACADGHVRLVDPESVEINADLPALDGRACSLAAGPDGSIAVGGERGQVRRLTFNTDLHSMP